jgi:cation-transporting ATPase E
MWQAGRVTAHPGTRATGLSAADVAQRVASGQRNDVPPRSGRSTADIVRANVFTRINAILAVLLVVVLATGSWINGAFGLLIIANSAIGIVQELRAKRTLDSLAVVGEARPRLRRDGVTAEHSRAEIVLDDLIEVGPGDQIVVDGVVVEAEYLEVDESLLTGESEPEAKAADDPVMSGSFVVAGTGAYRATRVGSESYAAQLTAEAAKFTLVKSELTQGINSILKVITWVLIPVGLATIVVQLMRAGADWRRAVLSMAGALVPMVPEGLILLTSVAFAVGVVRLGRRNCLVQELPAIEGLARVDVVCADKTGTLTENGMTFGELRPVEGMAAERVRLALGQVAAADPRPNASMQAIAAAVPAPSELWPVLAKAPFTSAKKWSGATFIGPDGGPANWVIGAPDVLAQPGSEVARQAENLAAGGLRVLLVGTAERPVDDPEAPGAVTGAALVVLNQRIRPDAADTLAYFADQGVQLKVISGDNAAAVGAVTRSLGVVSDTAVDARTLPVEPGPFAEAVEAADVFGRVTPHQKRAMVSALQSRGHTVAMTGDGVNDVLALKDADLGVARDPGGGQDRAARRQVRHPAVRGGRGTAGDRQHRTGREPVLDQDHLLRPAGPARGAVAAAVSVPADPHHHHRLVHHRHSGVPAVAGAQQRAGAARVRPTGAAAGCTGRRDRGVAHVHHLPDGAAATGRRRGGPAAGDHRHPGLHDHRLHLGAGRGGQAIPVVEGGAGRGVPVRVSADLRLALHQGTLPA